MADEWDLRQTLLDLSPQQFELAVGVILHEHGWDVTHTGFGSDGGHDLRIGLEGRDGVVEVKHAKQAVSPKDIRAIAGAALENNVSELAAVTMVGYTRGATKTAKRIGRNRHIQSVHLVDGDRLVLAGSVVNDIFQTINEMKTNESYVESMFNGQSSLDEWRGRDTSSSRREERYERARSLATQKTLFTCDVESQPHIDDF